MKHIELITEKNVASTIHLFHELDSYHILHRPEIKDISIEQKQLYILEKLKTDKDFQILSIKHKDEYIGICSFTVKDIENEFTKKSRVGKVEELFISMQWRNQGLGNTLMQEAIKALKAKNVDRIELNVYGFNPSAYHFYERLGFTTKLSVMELLQF